MDFKDVIKEDVAIFSNCKEFSAVHNVDGKEMPIVIDEMELIERENKYDKESMGEGSYQKKLLFFVPASVFGRLPKVGRILTLDGKKYEVIDANREDGIFSITIGARKA